MQSFSLHNPHYTGQILHTVFLNNPIAMIEIYWLLFSTTRGGSMGPIHYFYGVKTNKIAINSTTTEAVERYWLLFPNTRCGSMGQIIFLFSENLQNCYKLDNHRSCGKILAAIFYQ
jgi:hypothetical protein